MDQITTLMKVMQLDGQDALEKAIVSLTTSIVSSHKHPDGTNFECLKTLKFLISDCITQSRKFGLKICEILEVFGSHFCLPYIKEALVKHDVSQDTSIITSELMVLCYKSFSIGLQTEVLDTCARSFSEYESERQMTYFKDDSVPADSVLFATDLLAKIVKLGSVPDERKAILFNCVSSVLLLGEDRVVGRILTDLLPALMSNPEEEILQIWRILYKGFVDYGCSNSTDDMSNSSLSERPYFILCGLADVFLPVNDMMQTHPILLSNVEFWEILQNGLFHESSLTRKRSQYLLKRSLDIIDTSGMEVQCFRNKGAHPLFWWETRKKKQLQMIWDSFLLLSESLEGKQVHVIRPVLVSRLHETLIKATLPDENGLSLLHFSWVSCIVQRMACHDSTALRQWAVKFILTLDVARYPLFSHHQQQFLCGPLIKMMTDAKIFYKGHDVTGVENTQMEEALPQFFSGCQQALSSSERDAFFADFLAGLCRHNWNGCTLVFIAQGLSSLQPIPVLQTETLSSFRSLLSHSTNTVDLHVRGAVQCFLFTALIKLLHPESIEPAHVLPILAQLKQEESIMRGANLWKACSTWVQQLSVHHDSAWSSSALSGFLQQSFIKWLKPDDTGDMTDWVSVSHQDCLSLVRMLLLAADGGLLCDPCLPSSPVSKVMEHYLIPAIDLIVTGTTRSYVNMHSLYKALLLMKTLLHEGALLEGCETTEVDVCLKKVMDSCVEPLMVYFTRHLAEITSVRQVAEAYCHLSLLDTCLSSASGDGVMMKPSVVALLVTACSTLAQTNHQSVSHQLQGHVALLYVAMVCRHANKLSWQLPDGIHQPLMKVFLNWTPLERFVRLTEPDSDELCQELSREELRWGRISSLHISAQWNCIHYALMYDSSAVDNKTRTSALVDGFSGALDVVIVEHLTNILSSLHSLIQQASDDEVVTILTQCWRVIQEQMNRAEFWALFQEFLHLAFSGHHLLQPEGSTVHTMLLQISEDIVRFGEEKKGMMNVFVNHFLSKCNSNMQCVLHPHIIIQALAFGPIYSKGHRFVVDVLQYLVDMGDSLATNQLQNGSLRSATMVRVAAINYISRLQPTITGHVTLAKQLIGLLMCKQLSLVNNSTYKNFTNSLVHRQKHRIVCALLVLDSFIDRGLLKEGGLEDFIWQLMKTETQPSVRMLVEWLLIRLIQRFPSLCDPILSTLADGCEKKSAFLSALLSIVAHLAQLKSNQVEKAQVHTFFLTALRCVFPWCTSHHFTIRVFAQATTLILWKQCSQLGLTDVLSELAFVDDFVKHNTQNKSAGRNALQLMENFAFKLHPMLDYSLETIYRTLPYLTGITREEWIWPGYFMKQSSSDTNEFIPLPNASEGLSQCQPGGWKVKSPGDVEDVAEAGNNHGNVQRKVTPWRNMLPESELDIDFGRSSKRQSNPAGLILVTSLVDKLPNLGGLCRTSEIFGVSEFVIGNLDYIRDPVFESLSVTAHKWLPIKEVRASDLAMYLDQVRQKGYTLVGVEQTANSTCLTNYTFPTKTMLLLGNEKEGIPVELIQMLDVCVEIPQQGVIRSLNVHVSGALFVWEYTRQQLTPSAH